MNVSKSNWVNPYGTDDAPPMSLRYLNEFVGKLQCASHLLQLQIFPDAKEISESMGLFNAARRFLDLDDADDSVDGIVVVGDGSTPRTAAMFAYRTKGWTCYSVDPEMRLSTDAERVPWDGIQKVVPIRAKIEDIQIHLRRAIVVLVHAHVTLDQALASVHADTIVGVVTVPCCNWYGNQEQLFQRHPDIVYDDYSILSDHREVRLWRHNAGIDSVGLNQSTKAMTGCVVKSFVSPQDSIDAKSAALQLLHDDTLVKMVRGSIGTSELWGPLLSILTPLLVLRDNLRIGVLGDASKEFTSHFHQANNVGGGTTLIESFQLNGQYDLVLDLGMLHECMYLIESRVSSALVLKLCQSFQSTLTNPNGVFVCVTPRRKLKGTSYFANPQLKWRLESHSVGTSFVLVCRQQAPKPTAPSRDQVLADLNAVATNFPDQAAPRIVGEITGVRIKSRKLTFLDVSVNGVAMQVVLSRANMTQGHVANPDDVARHLRVGDTVCAQGALESPEKLDAHVISIVASRPVPVKPRYGIQ
ncbi:hypothetical protein H257_15669 [Aphanomyces astaci]|uniref:Uncharacterized protein n=1 Tax=Aphanomyces astaci TaxID=112090 RepID=W4FN41_APHAT|nr:hypothetical protein H257_15669 [Aphanomyces astaci]ETV68346.1 hypothetical protein H257_15669 [Aphanomyces astaci]|eukprot:XP_009842143.1 hypothetical protein H257_15669 [Aphanomyces astaci]